MLVSECLVSSPLTMSKEECLEELVYKILNSNHTTAAVIDDENNLLGIVGIHDVFEKILPSYVKMGSDMGISLGAAIHEGYFDEKFEELRGLRVEEIMVVDIDYSESNDSAISAISEMVKRRRKAIPVKDDDGKFVGMVTRRSILLSVYLKKQAGSK